MAAKSKEFSSAMKLLEDSPMGCRDLLLHPHLKQSIWDLAQPDRPIKPPRDLETYGSVPQWDRSKALILHGSSGLGKSSLARSLMPTALFVSHMEDLKMFKPGIHEGIIFDDMNWMGDPETQRGRWSRESQIHLVDWDNDRSIHCRYHNTTIPAGTPKVFTTNLLPREILLVHDEAIHRRTTNWLVFGNVGQLKFTVNW